MSCGCGSCGNSCNAVPDCLKIRQGVDQSFAFPATDRETGLPFDFTGWGVSIKAANRPGGTSRGSWSVGSGVSIVDGEIIWSLTASETAAMTWPQAVFEVTVTKPDASGPFFLREGTLETIAGV